MLNTVNSLLLSCANIIPASYHGNNCENIEVPLKLLLDKYLLTIGRGIIVGERINSWLLSEFRISLSVYPSEIIPSETYLSFSRTDLEILNGVQPTYLRFLPLNTSDVYTVSAYMLKSSFLRSSSISNPLKINFLGIDSKIFQNSIHVVLQYNQFIPMISPYEVITNTTCYDLDHYVQNYTCRTKPHSVLSVQCPGRPGNVINRCPIYNLTSTCKGLEGDNSTHCEMVSFTEMNVSCTCWFLPKISNQNSRKLMNSSSNITIISHSLGAESITFVYDFNSTFHHNYRSNSILISKIVFISMGSFATLILLMSIFSFGSDSLGQNRKVKKKSVPVEENASLPNPNVAEVILFKNNAEEDDNYHGVIERKVMNFKPVQYSMIENTLPYIFISSAPYLYRFFTEFVQHHRWFSILFHYSRNAPRLIRVITLASQILCFVFFDSLIFSLTNLDDGTCGSKGNERYCIRDSSCYWVLSNHQCYFRRTEVSIQFILIYLFIAALLSIPISRVFEYLILYGLFIYDKSLGEKKDNFENDSGSVTNTLTFRNGPTTVRRRLQDVKPIEYQTTPQQLISNSYNFSFTKVKPSGRYDTSVDTFKCISFICSIPLNVEMEMLQIQINTFLDQLGDSDNRLKSQFVGSSYLI